MGEKDYNNEEYINALVDRYKDTNSMQLRDELVRSFSPYFRKYAVLIGTDRTADVHNKDTEKFLRLFMTSEERDNEDNSLRASRKYVVMLRKIFCDYTPEDVYDEMLVYFLESLQKYKPMIADHKRTRERISFTHYIQVNLRYKLKNLAMIKSRDALSGDDHVEYNDLMASPAKPSVLPKNRYDTNVKWIYDSDSETFGGLTNMERYLLWLKYESDPDGKQLSSFQLAAITGLHQKTLVYRIKAIKEKLKGFIL